MLRKKPFISIICIFAIALLISGCSVSGLLADYWLEEQPSTDAVPVEEIALYDCRLDAWPIAQLHRAVDRVGCVPNDSEHVIIFIHGMGDYPNKAAYHEELELLTENYEAQVVMFHWPSWIDSHTLPIHNAAQSGAQLAALFDEIALLKQRDPNKKFSLLTHSMGGRVFQSYMEHYAHLHVDVLPSDLFEAVVLVAPEVPLEGHANWLEDVNFTQTVAVFMNESDQVLAFTREFYDQARLGMQTTHLDGSIEPRASNAIYVSVSHKTHRFYLEPYHLGLQKYIHLALKGEEGLKSSTF